MALGLYMDVHVPAAVTESLRRRGVDVLTSQEDNTREADDEVLLLRATELGRLLVSQDEDLLRLASQCQRTGQSFTGVAFARQLGISIGKMVEDLELLARCAAPSELANQVIYLPMH